MDVTNRAADGTMGHGPRTAPAEFLAHLEVTVWWGCAECGVDVELPVTHTAGFLVPCPDCSGPLHELWRWEPVSAA